MKPLIFPPVTHCERQTGCCPQIAAAIILDQLRNFLRMELPEHLVDTLAQRAETVFAGNEFWRRKLQGRHGREHLAVLLRHWFSAELARSQPAAVWQLPDDFKLGKPLPEVSRQRPLPSIAAKRTREKPSRSRGVFCHGSELLAF
jgi:hypothetical protein